MRTLPSLDRLDFRPVLFSVRNPPIVPRLRLPRDLDTILPEVVTILANDFITNAERSAVRVFAFNLLGEASFRNEFFEKAVDFFTTYLMVTFGEDFRFDIRDVEDVVGEFTTMYSCYLITVFPEVERAFDERTIAGIYGNVEILERILGPSLRGGDLIRREPRSRPVFDGRRESRHAAPRDPRVRPVSIDGREEPTPARQKFISGQRAETPAPAQVPIRQARPTQPRQQPAPVQETRVEGKKPEKKPANNIITGEIEDMDRKRHGIVYFGQTFEIPGSYKPYSESVEKLASEELSLENENINTTIATATTLPELLDIVRSWGDGIGREGEVYLTGARLIRPIVTPLKMAEKFDHLKAYTSFVDLAAAIRTTIFERAEEADLQKTVAYVGQIDTLLTSLINDFFKNGLGRNLSIDSFMDDIKDASMYLTKPETPQNRRKAWVQFQKNLMTHLFRHGSLRDKDATEVASAIAQDTSYDGMVVGCTVTYIAANSRELGYNISEKVTRVDVKSTPLLMKLVSSVQRHSTRIAPNAVVNYIVTMDRVCWKFYTDQVRDNDQFILVPQEL